MKENLISVLIGVALFAVLALLLRPVYLKEKAERERIEREWVQEQNQNLDLEEEELRNKDEAIDLAPPEESAPMLVGVTGDAKLAELMVQADALMSKSKLETSD